MIEAGYEDIGGEVQLLHSYGENKYKRGNITAVSDRFIDVLFSGESRSKKFERKALVWAKKRKVLVARKTTKIKRCVGF